MLAGVNAQRLGVHLAQPPEGIERCGLEPVLTRCQRALSLAAELCEHGIKRERPRLDVELQRLVRGEPREHACERTSQPLGAVRVEHERVARQHLEVANERAVGAHQQPLL